MIHFSIHRLYSRSLMPQFSIQGMGFPLPFPSSIFPKNKALGVVFGLLAVLSMTGEAMAAIEKDKETEKIAQSFESFEEGSTLSVNTGDLCAWERDLGFFLSPSKGDDKSERIDCTLRLKQEEVGAMKEEFQPADEVLTKELDLMVAGFPIEAMTKAIAGYDREIAGLIVGIGKKESNWGKRTPKLQGEECFNFWGYRGAGTKGFTPDGYGCWYTPEEAVKTIGDRLEKLRDIRLSTEPARMIVWKCGSTCAGHSDESVRKWIADVNIYYRKIAQK